MTTERTPWSITRRLQLNLLTLLALLWLTAMAATTVLVTHETNEVYDDVLKGTAEMLGELHDSEAGDGPIAKHLEHIVLAGERADYISYQFRRTDGSLRDRSKTAPGEPYPVALDPGFTAAGGIRYFTLALKDGSGVVQVAETSEERNEAFYGLLSGFLYPLIALMAIGSIIVWRSVRGVSVPMQDVAREIRTRSGDNLQALDAANVPIELRPIVGDTNRLMSRLRRALDAERAFAANWAHELRNPIAAARAQAELIARSSPGAERTRIDVLTETLQNLGQRVERLLQKSRAEGGASTSPAASDAVAVAELVIDSYYYLPGNKKLELDDNGFTAMPVAIDQDALAIVLQNLIDNAVANSPAGSAVRLSIEGDCRIHVANDCAIVPAEELAKIRSRFQRGSSATHGGFGLGLSIVQQILAQCGGALELKSPADGQLGGFQATVALQPSAAHSRSGPSA